MTRILPRSESPETPGRVTYREILKRRAQENGVDFISGVATAITPMAVFATVMAKGYETLVNPDIKVDVSTGRCSGNGSVMSGPCTQPEESARPVRPPGQRLPLTSFNVMTNHDEPALPNVER